MSAQTSTRGFILGTPPVHFVVRKERPKVILDRLLTPRRERLPRDCAALFKIISKPTSYPFDKLGGHRCQFTVELLARGKPR